MWKKSDDGKLINKLRCWLSTYCRKNYTSLPEDNTVGFIEFTDKGVLGVKSGTSKVSFSVKKNPTDDGQQWHWDMPEDASGWRRLINKQTRHIFLQIVHQN